MGKALDDAIAAIEALRARHTPAERAAMGCGDREFAEMPPRFVEEEGDDG